MSDAKIAKTVESDAFRADLDAVLKAASFYEKTSIAPAEVEEWLIEDAPDCIAALDEESIRAFVEDTMLSMNLTIESDKKKESDSAARTAFDCLKGLIDPVSKVFVKHLL